MTVWDDFERLPVAIRRRALAVACRDAVAVWERHVTARVDWIGGAVGSEHCIEPGLAARALDEVDRALRGEPVDPAATARALWDPITGLQHDELELPQAVAFAIYAVYNLHRLVFVLADDPARDAELLVLNQAISSTLTRHDDDAEIDRRVAAWWAKLGG